MRILGLFLIALLSFAGCSRHLISYDIKGLAEKTKTTQVVIVETFRDYRPTEEHEGSSGKFLAFASKDDDFKEPPSISITNLLKEEFKKSGLKAAGEELTETADYLISGEILHFQTMIKIPGTMIIPYLGTVATLWESDQYTTVVSIKARMEDKAAGKIIFEREFNISEELRLKTGLFNLERLFGRGLSYQFKRLNLALSDVLGQIRDEVIKNI